MIRTTVIGAVATWALFLWASASHAQGGNPDIYWRIDPSVKTCSMVIDPSLTQDQWHTFTRQVGALSSFKSLAAAEPLGRMNLYVAIDYASTPVNQRDPAWINTFVHPDADCPLGDAIVVPTIRARLGVSNHVDIGGFWTTAPDANYGQLGGDIKYAFLEESERSPAAAVRASITTMTGVPDFNMNIFSLDALASKYVARVTPYIGIRTSLVVGTETTSKVALNTERVQVVQGYAGVTCSLWVLNLAAEYDVSTVNTFALAVGHSF